MEQDIQPTTETISAQPGTMESSSQALKITVTRTKTSKKETKEKQKEGAEALIKTDEDCPDIYTDESAIEGTQSGGAGVVIPSQGITVVAPAGTFFSNFRAEQLAYLEAIELVLKRDERKYRIITDSLSLSEWLNGINNRTKWSSNMESLIWQRMKGTTMDQSKAEVPFETAKCAIKRRMRRKPQPTFANSEVYKSPTWGAIYPRDKGLSRRDQVEILRLRTGHHPDLKSWRTEMNLEVNDRFRLCRLSM